ncbi:hypothetical protein [Flavihumibacter sp.]|uniref:hypothetical protein n=1 Tax=Flavihumibacter sp. TaxID=1913981 RepID=UPI002FCC1D68
MANTKSKTNIITHNYGGKLDDQFVIRKIGSKSILASLPKGYEVKERFKPQFEQTKRNFKLAVIYAKKAIQNPELKEQYEAVRRGNQSAFNVAFQDKYYAPELSALRTESYTGQAGQQMLVEATDNFRVTKVVFTLFASDGTVLEEGDAVMDDNGFDWIYTTKVANPSPAGTIVRVTAEDIPKSKTILEGVI